MTEFRPGRWQVLPNVVKNIIIINIIMVVLQLVMFSTFHIDIQDYLALHYWRSQLFRPWQMVTHIFMHGSPNPKDLQMTVLHIFSNMFALWMFGSVLENIWGPKRFLIFYFVCGIGAALCHLGVLALQYEPIVTAYHQYQQNATLDTFAKFINEHLYHRLTPYSAARLNEVYGPWQADPGNLSFISQSKRALYDVLYGNTAGGMYQNGIFDEATVGASGAVFGVLFAFGYLFPNTLLYLYFAIPVKAKWFVTFYAIFELYSGVRNSAGDNVAHFAHLGGMLFAFILLKIWNRRLKDRFF